MIGHVTGPQVKAGAPSGDRVKRLVLHNVFLPITLYVLSCHALRAPEGRSPDGAANRGSHAVEHDLDLVGEFAAPQVRAGVFGADIGVEWFELDQLRGQKL